MGNTEKYLETIDWEFEAQKDRIYALELEQEFIQSQNQRPTRKPAKITYETNGTSSSFFRTFKKVLHARSNLSSKSYSKQDGCF